MRVPQSTTLRELRPARPVAVASPLETEVSVLYLPSVARDRMAIRDRLSRTGATVSLASDMPDALRMLGARTYGLVVIDLAGGDQAVATVRILRAQSSRVPVVGVMDPSDPMTAAEAVNAGISDLLPWPFDETDVLAAFATARDRGAVDLDAESGDEDLYQHSPAMRLTIEKVRAANSRKSGILLVGPRGSGRALVARFRHALDDDYVSRPFVTVDCDATEGADLERRLFGNHAPHDSGARVSVETVDRTGAIVAAQGGSLFLKNLAAAPAPVQARLAAVLRDREMFSLDAGEVIPVDVRVMAAAEADVDSAVSEGRLSRDLVDQIAGARIEVPPFGSRREDLPFVAMRFLRRACETERVGRKRFSRGALAFMAAMRWKGNASEMADAVTGIVRSTRQTVVQIDDVLEHVSLEASDEGTSASATLRDARERFEREFISRALVRHQGRVGDAARELGIQRTNLYRKVRQLKVSKSLLATSR
jgi:DNA-binding NtrC family response regulator